MFFSSRRRHTRFDCDWSSDVCSSDLDNALAGSWRTRSLQRLEGSLPSDEGSRFYRRLFLCRVREIAVDDRIFAEREFLTLELHIAPHARIDNDLAARELHRSSYRRIHTEHTAGPKHVAADPCSRDACLTSSHHYIISP